jgi:predicted SAM-dependent methyltransferase
MSSVDRDALIAYARAGNGRGINDADSPKLKLAKRFIPHGVREPSRRALTAIARPWARRRVAAYLSTASSVRPHLASGFARLDGWLNLDLVGAPVDAPWDLRYGIPVPDACAEAVFSEHFYEHIPFDAALLIHQESMRVLKPGGILRVGVPDAGLLLGSYAATNDSPWAEALPTRMLSVNALFYEYGHVMMYDAELLIALSGAVGFIGAEVREGGDSGIDPAPDTDHRRDVTLYVEARKPT